MVDANAVVNFLQEEIFARYGYPKVIISDNARIFQGEKYLRLCRDHGITPYYSPIYHQRSNPVERRVQELKKVLRALLCNKRRRHNWDMQLPRALHVLRGRTNAATGMSPSEALLGYRLPREGEWEIPEYLEERRRQVPRPTRLENVRRRQLDFQRKWYDSDARTRATFQVGQQVMTREGAPLKGELGDAWSGPHTVTARLSGEVYQVERNGTLAIVHVDDMRPAPIGNPEPQQENINPEEPGNHGEDFPVPPATPPERIDAPAGRPDPDGTEPRQEVVPRETTGPSLHRRGRRVRFAIRD